MATQFLDLAGLTHYDGKLKEKVAGSIKIEGLNVSLTSISGAVLGTIAIPQQQIELASGSKNGLMSKEHFTKLEGIASLPVQRWSKKAKLTAMSRSMARKRRFTRLRSTPLTKMASTR